MKVKDISHNYYRFYLSEKDGDDKIQCQEAEKSFQTILHNSVNQIGGWQQTRQNCEPKIWREKGSNLLLASTKGGWIKTVDGFRQKIIARSRLDVFILQTGALKEGFVDLSKLKREFEITEKPEDVENKEEKSLIVLSNDFNPPENRHSLIADCQCIFLELEDYKSNDSLETIFENIFEGVGYKNSLSRKIDLDFAHIAILESSSQAVWIIIPTDNEFLNKASEFVDNKLYEYFMAFSKVMNENKTVQQNLEKAKHYRYQLDEYLKTNLNKTPETLFGMERASERLADLRMALAVEMARAKRHINTININVGNVEKLLESEYLIKKKEELDKLLLNPFRLVREQIEADLSYCEIDLEKGNLTNEKLEDITQIRLAKWSRKATLFFGLLSAIGILQLFPNEFTENGNLDFVFSTAALFNPPFWVKFTLITSLIMIFLIIAFKDEIFSLVNRNNTPEIDNRLSSNFPSKHLADKTQDYIVANQEKEKVNISHESN